MTKNFLTPPAARLKTLKVVVALWLCVWAAQPAAAQGDQLPAGFSAIQGKYITVITDMPVTEELRSLTAAFDAAMPQWCAAFGMQLREVADWHVEAYVMLERRRFHTAGLIPARIPNFVYGFQSGDQLWVTEQPSDYYRRHLLLHEGTHWFMNRRFGSNGPPWLMEGMAELFATHTWDGRELQLNIVPQANTQVPYWGRVTIIQNQLAEGTAPSLEDILRYGNTAHQQVEAYAWSWAAVLFLRTHPDSRDAFVRMFQQPMRDDPSLTRWLFAELREQWPRLRGQWQAFAAELEYGYDVSNGFLTLANVPPPEVESAWVSSEIQANRTWQSAGISVRAGSHLEIRATGRFVVAQRPADWECEPQGVTLEYYRGRPLGQLLLSVVGPLGSEAETTRPLKTVSVGPGGVFKMEQSGELFLRINESNGGLSDNAGRVTVGVRAE